MSKKKPDFYLMGTFGVSTVFVLTPRSRAAEAWRREHIPNALAWGRNGVAIDHRYVGAILDGITNDGLTVGV